MTPDPTAQPEGHISSNLPAVDPDAQLEVSADFFDPKREKLRKLKEELSDTIFSRELTDEERYTIKLIANLLYGRVQTFATGLQANPILRRLDDANPNSQPHAEMLSAFTAAWQRIANIIAE